MEFGKVKDREELNRICFDLPPWRDQDTALFHTSSSALKPGHSPQQKPLYVGCPSWNQSSFLGTLYPQNCSPQKYLFYYSQQFNTIEFNTTFYRIPQPQTVTQWKNSTPSGFKFCPKVFQGISRFENLYEIPQLTRQYFTALESFEDRLGPTFLQLPPHFSPGYFPILKRFVTLIPKDISLHIEFRHPQWFQDDRILQHVTDLLFEHRVGIVITDVAGRRDVLHHSLTTPVALIRFVGNELHPTDFSRLQSWARRIEEWSQQGLGPFYFFIHQPEEKGYIELTERLHQNLSHHPLIQLKPLNDRLAEAQLPLF